MSPTKDNRTETQSNGTRGNSRPSKAKPAALPASLNRPLLKRLTALISRPNGKAVDVIAPFSGELLVELPQCTKEDVLAAADEARTVQAQWAKVDTRTRAAVFLRLHDLVFENRDTLMDLIQAENGKARRDAFLEVADIANTCRYYARKAPSLLEPQGRRGLIPMLTSVQELRHPKGIVTIISPWNYPLSLGAGDTIPALLAGNAVVQKPDNQTALTTLFMLDLALQAGLPMGLWQVVAGRGSAIGDSLLDVADYVMFTGSTESGRKIAAEAGRRLLDCSAELGGKNPVLILDDADLGRAVEGAVRACFSSSGQLCISGERMFIADSIWDEFVPRFVDAVKALRIGGAYDFSCNMGSLTSEDQLKTVQAHVDDAVAKGATVLCGGRARPDLGPYFYEPTVLVDVEPAMTCFGDETFGPLVSLYRFKTDDEAIAAANDTSYGLNSSVWSSSPTHGRSVAARLKTGTVNVNEGYAAAWGSIDAPMGGMGASGIGRRHGAGGILKYTEAQTVAHQRLMNIAPPLGLSDETFAKVMTTALKVMKRAGLS